MSMTERDEEAPEPEEGQGLEEASKEAVRELEKSDAPHAGRGDAG
jgi:hypothetical protein